MFPPELLERVVAYVGDGDTLRSMKSTCWHLFRHIRCHPRVYIQCAGCGSRHRWSVTSRSSQCIVPGCMVSGIHYRVRYFTRDGLPLCSYGCMHGI